MEAPVAWQQLSLPDVAELHHKELLLWLEIDDQFSPTFPKFEDDMI